MNIGKIAGIVKICKLGLAAEISKIAMDELDVRP
jgi:hypothetical protein